MNPLIAHKGHEHHPSIQGRKAVADSIWEQEHIELVTVGIDIGSSTSHLIFAKVHLQRRTQGLSSRYEVIKREILWQSPIRFTPFLDSGLIDANAWVVSSSMPILTLVYINMMWIRARLF